MLLVLCIDLDDDVGRKTDIDTPVVGSDAVREAAIALATVDPEDSDLNVMFQGLSTHDSLQAEDDEAVEVAVVTGVEGNDVTANRTIGDEIDTVLAGLQTGEEVSAIVITDGAQDESVIPIIRSRMPIDGVRRGPPTTVVVRVRVRVTCVVAIAWCRADVFHSVGRNGPGHYHPPPKSGSSNPVGSGGFNPSGTFNRGSGISPSVAPAISSVSTSSGDPRVASASVASGSALKRMGVTPSPGDPI